MRVLNAIAGGGAIFDAEGNLIYPEWPENGHLRCPRLCDQELFSYLETINWAKGKIYASVRWWARSNDDPIRGPEFKAGTFGFRGSGVHFYFLEGELGADNLHFLCEVPWDDLKGKLDGKEYFYGGVWVRQAFLARIKRAHEKQEDKLRRLQKDMEGVSSQLEMLRLSERL
jgi:hypothetical protein